MNQESGVRNQESGVRSQESGVRYQVSGLSYQLMWLNVVRDSGLGISGQLSVSVVECCQGQRFGKEF